MIIIVAKGIVKEGKKEEYKALAQELVQETNKEAGCKSYNLHEDCNNGNIVAFIEEWEDDEAIKLHNNSVHFTTIVPKLSELLEKRMEINLYKRI